MWKKLSTYKFPYLYKYKSFKIVDKLMFSTQKFVDNFYCFIFQLIKKVS